MDNLEIYENVKTVPDYAKKTIESGRMKGKTDISPMWRIQKLTEIFGPCGIGWWYVIKDQRLETGANGVISAFVDIDLYYKWDGELSQPIPGIGGNSFVAKETGGLHTSDECFKMALTDAISVAAKALGVGADVYMGSDRTKYSGSQSEGEVRGYNYQGRRDDPRGNRRDEARDKRCPPAPKERNARPQDAPPRNDGRVPTQPIENSDGYFYCWSCGEIIKAQRLNDGHVMQPRDVAELSLKRCAKQLCAECLKKHVEQGKVVE